MNKNELFNRLMKEDEYWLIGKKPIGFKTIKDIKKWKLHYFKKSSIDNPYMFESAIKELENKNSKLNLRVVEMYTEGFRNKDVSFSEYFLNYAYQINNDKAIHNATLIHYIVNYEPKTNMIIQFNTQENAFSSFPR